METVKVGNEKLLVEFKFDDCILFAQVLAMDESLRGELRKEILHKGIRYHIWSDFVPELDKEILYLRGRKKVADNRRVFHHYPSVKERDEAFNAFVKLIMEINHGGDKMENETNLMYDTDEGKWVEKEKIKIKENNKMKKGEIQVVKNGLTNVTDGELELLVPGYCAADFDVRIDGYRILITYKDLKTGEKRLLDYYVVKGYEVKIEECSCKNGIFKLKVSYDLGEKIEVEGE